MWLCKANVRCLRPCRGHIEGQSVPTQTSTMPGWVKSVHFSKLGKHTKKEGSGVNRPCSLWLMDVYINGASLRDLAHKPSMLAATLYRRVKGIVAEDSRLGSTPVLCSVERRLIWLQWQLVFLAKWWCIWHQVRGIRHSFKKIAVGHRWFEAFEQGTLISPETLSYTSAKSVNFNTVEDYLANLDATKGRGICQNSLHLMSKLP